MTQNFSHRTRAPRRFLALLSTVAAALTIALAGILNTMAPASAHDTLLNSDPADGSVLETSPEQITLTYSADILAISPVVRVDTASGDTVATIDPVVDGPTVTAPLPGGLAPGEYTILWRVVSSDGHPIEGSFALTITGGEGTLGAAPAGPSSDTSADPSGETSDAPADASTETPAEASPSETASTESESGSLLGWIIGAVVALLLLGGAAVVLTSRRKNTDAGRK